MIVWLKAVHILALMVWCAGLFILPIIFARRSSLRDEPLREAHRFARSVFIHVTSPAALVTIAAGTSLIFLRDVFTIWMSLKLVAVGALVVLHVRHGYVLLHLFEPGQGYGRWRQYTAASVLSVLIVTILALVLAKPEFDVRFLPPDYLRPGKLQSLLETMVPMP